jgi:hypothetical protein
MTRPLILDVDGTFLKNDLTHEMILEAVRQNPAAGLSDLIVGAQDKPNMKQRMVARIGSTLLQGAQPVEPEIVALAKEAKASGRPVFLCSGSEASLVERLAAQYEFLDGAFGTSPTYNMTSENKATFLLQQFPDGFDYAGNSTQDYAVWEVAQSAYAIRPPSGTEFIRSANDDPVNILIERPRLGSKLALLLRGFEVWKLVVLLLPLLILSVLIGLSASQMLYLAAGVSILFLGVNTGRMLARIHQDRQQRGTAYKDNPLASGDLSIPLALIACVSLFGAGLALLALLTPWIPLAIVSVMIIIRASKGLS